MDDTNDMIETPPVVPQNAGARLRAARESLGLTVEQVAAQTRIPLRHLITIESADYDKLPGRTYAVGFSRTYAKTVGLNENEIVTMVRAELDERSGRDSHRPATFEPGDPARVPSRGLGWLSVAAVVLLLAGGFAFFRTALAPAGELPSLTEQADAERAAAQRAAAANARQQAQGPVDPGGEVVFTALEDGVWVKFYDAAGQQLMQKQMARGERYVVPANAAGPQVWTGRPDAFSITIGGRQVAKLAEDDVVMKDVPVTAEALLARASATPATAPAGENPAAPAT
ncbi:helix-turn-helix domain-containing protein [Tsuneonella sp. HG222]